MGTAQIWAVLLHFCFFKVGYNNPIIGGGIMNEKNIILQQ